MMLLFKTIKAFVLVFLCSLLFAACRSSQKKERIFNGYNISAPEKFNMPGSLTEISGIAFHNGNGAKVYAVQDEEGKLYSLDWNIKKQTHCKFAKGGDFEDLALLNEKFYLLKSNGAIFSFPFAEAAEKDAAHVKEMKGLVPTGEYEGMCVDAAAGLLYVLCKNCLEDDGKTASVYRFTTGDTLIPAGSFRLSVDSSSPVAEKIKKNFRPSAIAKNPFANEWYVVSAVNKMLLLADSTGKITKGVKLSDDDFGQPEGIAFDSEGSLYISNEGNEVFPGNILKFRKGAKQ